jgi:hypothetical protein
MPTMKTCCLIAALLLSTSFSPALKAADEEGFVPLFNGKDLTGWRPVNVAADTFSVRDGMIVTTGEPTGFMATEKQYENFIVELDWQHMVEGGNSGLFIWGEGLPAPGVPYAKGIEVQILDLGYEKQHADGAWKWFTSHGDIFPIWGATMTPQPPTAQSGKRSFPSEKRTKPSPEWNHYRVTCNKGEIRLEVNGKEVTVGKDCVPRKGFICLESEGSEAHFKNIRIKELPASNTPPEQTAEAYSGFKQLFDGKGFAGWKITDANKDVWKVDGLQVTAKTDAKGKNRDLWSEKSFKDFVLVADYKLAKKPQTKPLHTFTEDGLYAVDAEGKPIMKELPNAGDTGIYLRGSARNQVNIWSQPMGSGGIIGLHKDKSLSADVRKACMPKANADLKPGQWNRFVITMKGDRATVVLNGQTVIDNAQLPGVAAEGPIGLQYLGDAVEFANLFVKEL